MRTWYRYNDIHILDDSSVIVARTFEENEWERVTFKDKEVVSREKFDNCIVALISGNEHQGNAIEEVTWSKMVKLLSFLPDTNI